MAMRSAQELTAGIEIRGPEAVWVLTAHVYALVVPFVFIGVVASQWGYLSEVAAYPFALFLAGSLFAAGAAFEVAQNQADGWYLTRESPSAYGVGVLDLLFYVCITAGQSVAAIAIGGDRVWVWVVALGSMIAMPLLYLTDGGFFAALGMSNLVAIWVAYEAFGTPIVFLQLLAVGATLYFFQALMRTQAQALHGFTTISASSGVWFLLLAISAGAAGRPGSWWLPSTIAVVAGIAAALLWPRVTALPASSRVLPRGGGVRAVPGGIRDAEG
jgi:hypothetical protein